MKTAHELQQALLVADAGYDENPGLLRGVVGPTRYHTRLEPGTPIHPTRESMVYAAALLESPEEWRRERAGHILQTLLPMQEKNSSHPACGVWPWYWEEPLHQMAPPDGNWADFLGVQLIRIVLNDRTPHGILPGVMDALRLAAGAIRRRNVRLSYTNIAIMGAYVCVMAGRLLADDSLLAYGRQRLRDFVVFTRTAGGFPEYNSPTYTVVSLAELSRMLQYFDNEDDRRLVREIHDMAWSEIALHWHAPSRQWAGPHSRSYSTLLQAETLGFIQRGLGGHIALVENPPPSLDWCSLRIHCPDSLVPLFLDTRPRFQRTDVISQGSPPLLGTTHAAPEFVLSSAERATFWNQARGLVAYAPPFQTAQAFSVRFLHDGYDFCAANLLTRQCENRILAAVCLASDGGDRHGELDRFADARIAGEDWRIRFEFLNGTNPPPLDLSHPWVIPFGESAVLVLHWLHGEWGGSIPCQEVVCTDYGFAVDVILHRAERREFHFHDAFPASLAFALEIRPPGRPSPAAPKCVVGSKKLQLEWSGGLALESPRFPRREKEILDFARSSKSRLASSGPFLQPA